MAQSKRCRQCGETKPLEDFYKFAPNKDGRESRCRACADMTACYTRPESTQGRKDARRAAYLASPESKASTAAYNAAYYKENRDERIAYGRAYRKAKKEERND